MKAIKYLLIVLAMSTFYSCGDDDEVTLNENLVYTVFEISNANNLNFSLSSSAGTESFTASSNSFSFTSKVFSAPSLSGVTFYYMFTLSSGDLVSNNGCIDINAKTYHNNDLYEDRNYSIGYFNFPSGCANGSSIFEQYGIIAD